MVRKRNNESFIVPRLHNGDDLFHPVAKLPIQDDGDIREIGFRALSNFSRRNEEGPRTYYRRVGGANGRLCLIFCAFKDSGVVAQVAANTTLPVSDCLYLRARSAGQISWEKASYLT